MYEVKSFYPDNELVFSNEFSFLKKAWKCSEGFRRRGFGTKILSAGRLVYQALPYFPDTASEVLWIIGGKN